MSAPGCGNHDSMRRYRSVSRWMRWGGAAIACFVMGGSANAQSEAGFQDYLGTLRAEAEAAGVSRATIASVFPTLTMNPRVIELDRAQPGGNPNAPIPMFAPYQSSQDRKSAVAGKSV